jgi:hypothetical protein
VARPDDGVHALNAFWQHDIAITGRGTLDGQASDEWWWPWKSTAGKEPGQAPAMLDWNLEPGKGLLERIPACSA